MGTGRMGSSQGVYKGISLSKVKVAREQKIVKSLIDKTLDPYKKAMGIKNYKGPDVDLVVKSLGWSTLGSMNQAAQMELNRDYMNGKHGDVSEIQNTFPHEYTHYLMDELITKLYNVHRGSVDFRNIYYKGSTYELIQEEAFKLYDKYMDKLYRDLQRGLKLSPLQRKTATDWHNLDKVNNLHLQIIGYASRLSGMRDYAMHQYSWYPSHILPELPTVAAEKFFDVGYNWHKLLNISPYSYFLLTVLRKYARKKP